MVQEHLSELAGYPRTGELRRSARFPLTSAQPDAILVNVMSDRTKSRPLADAPSHLTSTGSVTLDRCGASTRGSFFYGDIQCQNYNARDVAPRFYPKATLLNAINAAQSTVKAVKSWAIAPCARKTTNNTRARSLIGQSAACGGVCGVDTHRAPLTTWAGWQAGVKALGTAQRAESWVKKSHALLSRPPFNSNASLLNPLRATPGPENPRDRHQSAASFGSKIKSDRLAPFNIQANSEMG